MKLFYPDRSPIKAEDLSVSTLNELRSVCVAQEVRGRTEAELEKVAKEYGRAIALLTRQLESDRSDFASLPGKVSDLPLKDETSEPVDLDNLFASRSITRSNLELLSISTGEGLDYLYTALKETIQMKLNIDSQSIDILKNHLALICTARVMERRSREQSMSSSS